MVEIIEGIVLKTSDYQEKSKILQVFTKEHGLIGIYLKGANNYKSHNYLLSQPITHASFNINYKEGLSSCFTGETIHSFQSLKLDLEKNLYSFHLFELILKSLEQHQANSYLYQLLLTILLKSEETADLNKIRMYTLFFELKFLYFLGIAPHLSNCVECGSSQDIINFDISRGGFVCKSCQQVGKLFTIETLQSMYQMYYLDNLDQITELNEPTLKELRLLVNEYYYYHQGYKTNSSKYLT